MIRNLTIKDIPDALRGAEIFSSESDYVNADPNTFAVTVSNLIRSDDGIVIGEFEGNVMIGALGGMKYKCPISGTPTAAEIFWFVFPEHRSKFAGPRMMKKFEEWAKEKHCRKLIMVHMADLMPVKLTRYYERQGYRLMEQHFTKEV